MPNSRRPHADGSAFAGQSKGKEKSFGLDYDEDDLPEMALALTELLYKESRTLSRRQNHLDPHPSLAQTPFAHVTYCT